MASEIYCKTVGCLYNSNPRPVLNSNYFCRERLIKCLSLNLDVLIKKHVYYFFSVYEAAIFNGI